MTNHRVTPEEITSVEWNELFVFGSNESGLHGAGAAKVALAFEAQIGVGFGPQGNTFAIPTKDWLIQTLPLEVIEHYVKRFIVFAKEMPNITFLVTAIGCGLAGYTPAEIAPMFKDAVTVENIHLPQSFWNILLNSHL